MSRRFRIVFASACALLSVMLCAVYAQHVQGEAERVRTEAMERYGGEVVSLVVASAPLEPGDVVSQSNVSTRDWLADLAPEGAVTKLDDVLGKEVSEPAPKGAPLTDVNFRADETMAEVPENHVALTLPITDKLGLSRNVAQGSKLEAYEVGEEGTKLVATEMEVLSKPQANTSLSGAQVTVAVLPDNVSAVLAASAAGDLRLVVPADDVSEGAAPAKAPEEVPAAEDGNADASAQEAPVEGQEVAAAPAEAQGEGGEAA